MSSTIANRLQEIAEQGEQRRQRVSHVRQRSLLLIGVVQQVSRSHAQRAAWTTQTVAARPVAAGTVPDQASVESVAPDRETDVLSQVRAHLDAIGYGERDQWTDEDTLILNCFWMALGAARRKGYALAVLLAILEELAPPDLDR